MSSFIKEKLSEYIEFDIDRILNNDIDAAVFGGAIRDIIANKQIHDVDIMCLSHSFYKIIAIIKENGYKTNPNLAMKDMYAMYKDIHIIQEPITYFKNDKIIQLIRPQFNTSILDTIKKVDLTCCGVDYTHQNGLRETIPNAIIHCKLHLFQRCDTNEMYHKDRIYSRMNKLERRGWKDYESLDREEKTKIDLSITREKKLLRIIEDSLAISGYKD